MSARRTCACVLRGFAAVNGPILLPIYDISTCLSVVGRPLCVCGQASSRARSAEGKESEGLSRATKAAPLDEQDGVVVYCVW